jgi:hypothetical protein
MNLTRFSIALVSLSWISLSAHSAELQQLPTHTSSRVLVTSDEAGNKAYEYSWPAIYFETAFNGDSLTIKFDDDQNNFHLIIDSQTPIAIKKPGKQDYVVLNPRQTSSKAGKNQRDAIIHWSLPRLLQRRQSRKTSRAQTPN